MRIQLDTKNLARLDDARHGHALAEPCAIEIKVCCTNATTCQIPDIGDPRELRKSLTRDECRSRRGSADSPIVEAIQFQRMDRVRRSTPAATCASERKNGGKGRSQRHQRQRLCRCIARCMREVNCKCVVPDSPDAQKQAAGVDGNSHDTLRRSSATPARSRVDYFDALNW